MGVVVRRKGDGMYVRTAYQCGGYRHLTFTADISLAVRMKEKDVSAIVDFDSLGVAYVGTGYNGRSRQSPYERLVVGVAE